LVIGVTKNQAIQKWPQYEKQIRNKQISWLGTLSRLELTEKLSSADVLLHSSLEESYCMAAAEALALGIPVVGPAECRALASLIGKAGILVENLSPIGLSDALLEYFTNLKFRTEVLNEAVKKGVSFTDSNKKSMQEICDIYMQLIR